ncbi:MAG: DUF5343 domain-containing protein [Bacilli bacterium]|nr:DUF5343 domain-containing protein [Bacilli bacterium]MDD4705674.1 DUF5343 domain-containing protein [Bacilli bacterium]
MELPTSYMTGAFAKIPAYFDAMLTAKAPERFTIKFLENIGFKSSSDRLFINVLKTIGLLDDSGTPTKKYFDFLDQSISKKVVAEGIRDAYADLFEINKNAQTMTQKELEGKLNSLTEGKKGKRAVEFMAKTFKALCDYADWESKDEEKLPMNEVNYSNMKKNDADVMDSNNSNAKLQTSFDLSYDIHIHLPATRDPGVYDALFESLMKHLSSKK